LGRRQVFGKIAGFFAAFWAGGASGETSPPGRISMRERRVMVNELRFAITSEDFDTTVRLYRDILGLEQIADWGGDHGEGILLRVPAATLEILSKKHAAYVDRIEVGRATGARVRLAASVQEVDSLAAEIEAAGAGKPLSSPRITPWGDRSLRIATGDDIQLTLFAPSPPDK
jgi:catechol 2,3-dioxygenase-like lactoylglutathione lyase family enzyme